MASVAPSRLTVALSFLIVAVLAVTVGLRGGDGAAPVGLSRATIGEPAVSGDVVPASALAPDQTGWSPATEASTETVPPATAPPTTIPVTAAPPPPTQPASSPEAAAPAPAPAPTTAPRTTAAPGPAASSSSAGTRDVGCEASMMRWMNEARASRGVRTLTSDGSIHHVALGWTDRMVQRQDLSHNPDYGEKIFAARPEAVTAGENVGRGTGTERGLFDAFMASSSHRAKILGSHYSHATVACVVDSAGQLWVTQNFWG